MDEPCSRDVLRACLRDIARVNRWTLGYRPLFRWTDAILSAHPGPLRILDVGCGNGDALRRIARRAEQRGIPVELIGLDINRDAVSIAAEATAPSTHIEWIATDVFAYVPRRRIHLVISSLFTHHLSDAEVIRFLRWMERNAELGWFVNDLSRGAMSYFLLDALVRLANLHHFVQHDGPVSIARSFSSADWQHFCASAGLRREDAAIQAYKPGRLCVARSKMR